MNRSQSAIIDHRRRAVAALRLRGLTVREIEEALAERGIVNEKGSKPWSRGVIQNDLTALGEEWQKAARASTDELKANILAELREARRAAWAAKRYDLVLRALEDERKLYGLDAPARTELSGVGGAAIEVKLGDDLSKLTDEELDLLSHIASRFAEDTIGEGAPEPD